MRTSESFLALIAELEGDHQEFLRLMVRNDRAWKRIQGGANDPLDCGAFGERMALEIPGVRPALIGDESAKLRAIADGLR